MQIPEEEFDRIEDTCEKHFLLNSNNTTSVKVVNYLKQLLRPQSYNPIIILAVILSLQQLSGVYTIVFFSITVFKDIGENFGDKLSDAGALIILSLTRFIMSLILAHSSKIMGRKQLCLISGIGMSFSMLFSTMYLYINSAADKSQTGVLSSQKWLLLVIMLLYICATSIGFFDIPWALIGEILPSRIRGVFCGLFVSGAHLVMFGVIKAYPYVLKVVGIQYAFVFFCVNSVIMTIYVHFYLPETKDRHLSEIEHYFAMNRKVINISGVWTIRQKKDICTYAMLQFWIVVIWTVLSVLTSREGEFYLFQLWNEMLFLRLLYDLRFKMKNVNFSCKIDWINILWYFFSTRLIIIYWK